MEALCCHGNQSSNPIAHKTYAAFPLPDDALHEIWTKISQLILEIYYFV